MKSNRKLLDDELSESECWNGFLNFQSLSLAALWLIEKAERLVRRLFVVIGNLGER